MKTAKLVLCTLACSTALASPAPRLDGFVNDAFWSEKSRTWTLFDAAQPGSVARCYLGYDDQYLYFAADVTDTNVVGANRTAKSKAWEDDAIKLLVHTGDPDATRWTGETVSYTFSATGGITWSRGPLPEPLDPALENTWPPNWDSQLDWAVGLKPGTAPNAAGTADKGYAVEARIPWAELRTRAPFQPGATINICIVNINRPEMALPGGKPISSVPSDRTVTPGNPGTWERVAMDWYGPLPIRGLVKPLPMWLGSPSGEYDRYKSDETDLQGLWWNREHWQACFARMRSQNMNALVLRHTNPGTGLLEPAKAQTRPAATLGEAVAGSGWFPPAEFERCRDQFRWILAEAEQAGIRVHLMLSNEGLPPARPASRPASAAADDAAPEAGAIAGIAQRLLETYPALAGIVAGSGFNSPGTLAELAEAMRARAGAAGSAPADSADVPRELWIFTTGLDAGQAAQVSDRFAHVRLLHSLQGPHWHMPLARADLNLYNRQVQQLSGTAGHRVPSIVLGSMHGALAYVFWADPQWARTLMLDIRNQGHQGFLLDDGPGDHEVGREALFEYAYNAGQGFSTERWQSRLQLYGVGEYAGQLLEAMQHASAIVPESLLLISHPSERFMPQFGSLLVQYTALPTYSAFFAADQPSDLRSRLLPPLGPAWNDPVWGRPVASIRGEADGSAAPDAVSAHDIAANLTHHVDACKSLLPGLRHLKSASPEQAAALSRLLDEIEFNVMLGEHMAFKIRSAIGFEQYRSRRGRAVDCVQPLQKSVNAWESLARIAARLYPDPVPHWELQVVSPPPWTPELLDRSFIRTAGHWRDQLRRFERELSLVRDSTANASSLGVLPLWDHVSAVPEDRRQTRFVFDFEQADARLNLLPGSTVAEGQPAAIIGKKGLVVDTRQMPAGRHEVFLTDPAHVPLMSLQPYQIAIIYRVIDPGSGPQPFEIGVRPAVGGEPIGDHRTWTAPPGHTSSRILQVPAPAQDGNVVYIATNSPAAIAIDAIMISQVMP